MESPPLLHGEPVPMEQEQQNHLPETGAEPPSDEELELVLRVLGYLNENRQEAVKQRYM